MKIQDCKHVKGFLAALALLLAAPAPAQTIDRGILAEVLKDDGFVIVMRHADSPRQLPDAAIANPDNVNRERQLDEAGRRGATAMGEALIFDPRGMEGQVMIHRIRIGDWADL